MRVPISLPAAVFGAAVVATYIAAGALSSPARGGAVPHRAMLTSSRDLGRFLLAGAPAAANALETLTYSAEQGDVEAQLALGKIYLEGTPVVTKDTKKAAAWFLCAEAQHHPSAAYYLGVMSQRGEGRPPNPVEAARWFGVAAKGGSSQAMFLLGNAYRYGQGVPKDEAKAVALYTKAAELEHPAALQALAMAFGQGELGLTPDQDESQRYAMEAEHAIRHPAESP
jgi:TPR repeat protein